MKKNIFIAISILLLNIANAQIDLKLDEKATFELQSKTLATLHNMGAQLVTQPMALSTIGNKGYYLSYVNGNFYYDKNSKANYKLLKGDILNKWAALNYDNGILGMVIGSEAGTNNKKGSFAKFENGFIYWTHQFGARAIIGEMMNKYLELGREESQLGFPKTDEMKINSNGFTSYQQFERGTLFLNAATKEILLMDDANATVPKRPQQIGRIRKKPQPRVEVATPIPTPVVIGQIIENNYELTFTPNGDWALYGYEGNDDPMELFGGVLIQLIKANGEVIKENLNKNENIINLINSVEVRKTVSNVGFKESNTNFHRQYTLTQKDIDELAYIKLTFNLWDRDNFLPKIFPISNFANSAMSLIVGNINDALHLINPDEISKPLTEKIFFGKNINYRSRIIKIKDIQNSNNTLIKEDKCADGDDILNFNYKLTLTKK